MAAGQTRRDRLCHSWPEPGRATRQRSCRSVRSRRGGCVLGAMLSCAAAKAVATSLLGLRCAHGSDGDTLSTWEVEGELRHVGLAP